MDAHTAVCVTVALLVTGASVSGPTVAGAASSTCGVASEIYHSPTLQYIIGGREATVNEFPWLASLQVLPEDEDPDFDENEYDADDRNGRSAIHDVRSTANETTDDARAHTHNGGHRVNRKATGTFSGDRWNHVCGASLIGESWLLTSAHCVPLIGEGLLRVVFGARVLNTPDEDRAFSLIFSVKGRIFVHKEHFLDNLGRSDYDSALIRLPKPLDFKGAQSHVGKICLPITEDLDSFTDSVCVTGGWGGTDLSGDTTYRPRALRTLSMRVLTVDACQKAWNRTKEDGGLLTLTRRHMCAVNSADPNSMVWLGDSGGPLQCKRDGRWVLAGVTSFGRHPKDSKPYPDVFARVTEIMPWLCWMDVLRPAPKDEPLSQRPAPNDEPLSQLPAPKDELFFRR